MKKLCPLAQIAMRTRSRREPISPRTARLPRLAGLALILPMIACVWQSTAALAQEEPSLPSAVSLSQALERQGAQSGMAIWSRLLALNTDSPVVQARTLFIPSDDAFRHLPGETVAILLNSGSTQQREKLLERGASAESVSIGEIAKRRVQLKTLDGRLLTIDATGNEIRVGNAEAIAVKKLEDGRVVFVLDDIIADSLFEK